jgi:hypothetical protein
LCRSDKLVDQLINQCQSSVAVPALDGQSGAVFDFATKVDDCSAKFTVRQIDANQVARIIYDTQQDGRLAADRRPQMRAMFTRLI